MKNYLALVLFLCVTSIFAQSPEGAIITKAQNDAWIAEFIDADLEARIQLLKIRLVADNGVPLSRSYPDAGRYPKVIDTGIVAQSRPLYVFKIPSESPMPFRQQMSSAMLTALVKVLNKHDVDEIALADRKIAVLYGTSAKDGLIFVTLKSENQFKALKELRLDIK